MKNNFKKLEFKGKKFLINEQTSSIFYVRDFNEIEKIQNDIAISKPRWENEFREINPQLQLCLSMACNLSCKYCVFREREIENKAKMMTMKTAVKAVDMFFEKLPKDQKFARIDFGVTGEPFIAEEHHEALKKYIRKLCNKNNKIVWVGANMSNGLLLEPKNMIKKLGSPMDVSIDGVREDHDKFRRYKDGNGTYSDLIKLISLAKNKNIDIGACSVITGDTLNIAENFKHIFDLGINASIYMKPVNCDHEKSYALNKKNLPKFKLAYEKFVDFLLSSSNEVLTAYIKTINPEDFFFRYFYRILNRSVLRYRCNCGKSGLYVDWDGKIYPCAHFVGAKGQAIGDVQKGVKSESKKLFLNQVVDKREKCNKCWARYLCGGGCYYQAWLANKDIKKPDLVKCELIKHFIKLQAYFISELMLKKPDILRKLDNPYFSGAINSVPPQKRGLFSPREIGIIGNEYATVKIGDYKFQIKFEQRNLKIRIPKNKFKEINIHIDKNIKNEYQWDEVCFYRDTFNHETYRLENDGDVRVYKNKISGGFIEVPFHARVFKKFQKLKNVDNEIIIPINKTEIGFNISIVNNKRITSHLVQEIFGKIQLDQKIKKSRIDVAPTQKRNIEKKKDKSFGLWLDHESSDLFKNDDNCISFDSSVC